MPASAMKMASQYQHNKQLGGSGNCNSNSADTAIAIQTRQARKFVLGCDNSNSAAITMHLVPKFICLIWSVHQSRLRIEFWYVGIKFFLLQKIHDLPHNHAWLRGTPQCVRLMQWYSLVLPSVSLVCLCSAGRRVPTINYIPTYFFRYLHKEKN